jgi:hypothetical protein
MVWFGQQLVQFPHQAVLETHPALHCLISLGGDFSTLRTLHKLLASLTLPPMML